MPAKITFIARHYPPSPNINGESVWDMVKYLQENYGIESNVICISRSFAGGGHKRESAGNVIKLKTLYEGNNAILRFITFLYDGFILTRKALQYKNTLLIVTTSPPMLPFWASLFIRKKATWGLWTFDLFPEGFHVTKLISKKNKLYQWAINLTYKNAPSFLIALGEKQAGYISQAYKKEIPALMLPCGVFFYQEKSSEIPDWWESDKIILGYCGNVADPHNPDFIKAAIDSIDPHRHKLILALYGKHAGMLKEYAKDKRGVVLVNNVPRSQLHYIHIHLVSLREEWTHIAVPSKAVSAISLGSPILFCGSRESDNWYLLQEAAWFIDERKNIFTQVQQFIQSVTLSEIEERKARTGLIYERLKKWVLDTYKAVAEKAQAY